MGCSFLQYAYFDIDISLLLSSSVCFVLNTLGSLSERGPDRVHALPLLRPCSLVSNTETIAKPCLMWQHLIITDTDVPTHHN